MLKKKGNVNAQCNFLILSDIRCRRKNHKAVYSYYLVTFGNKYILCQVLTCNKFRQRQQKNAHQHWNVQLVGVSRYCIWNMLVSLHAHSVCANEMWLHQLEKYNISSRLSYEPLYGDRSLDTSPTYWVV